eukprot:TRINITY_DN21492_c0_g1_i1.p1 TRINITY_DN21492_c0_g1~~TRINITY_DN21492_c0_g1_i1.p1  ORF type:complete len:215 (+),score=8.92 TRINITY_DN21492_c0_g1_i1:44-688(+)
MVSESRKRSRSSRRVTNSSRLAPGSAAGAVDVEDSDHPASEGSSSAAPIVPPRSRIPHRDIRLLDKLSITGLSDRSLNGSFFLELAREKRVNRIPTLWSLDETVFMYWQQGPSRWAITPRFDPESRADLLMSVQAGQELGLVYQECAVDWWSCLTARPREIHDTTSAEWQQGAWSHTSVKLETSKTHCEMHPIGAGPWCRCENCYSGECELVRD